MTAGILTIACSEGEVELEIEPSTFLIVVDDLVQSHPLYFTDPDFQPYFAKACVSYKADRTVKEKPHGKQEVWQTASEALQRPSTPSSTGSPATSTASMPSSSSSSSKPVPANPLPPNQYRYSFALEDETAPKRVLK
ncbi:hypothetical protein PAXINDRAFT_7925 [Paxillus involutus ATCC 200175]|nr:hypothetical protein PAXINDRAFT_7925 [Paxillus involutus ATCC 200175]